MEQPKQIINAYDNHGATLDRFSIHYRDADGEQLICCCSNPSHPQGVFSRADERQFDAGPHLGDQIAWKKLPVAVRRVVLSDIGYTAEEINRLEPETVFQLKLDWLDVDVELPTIHRIKDYVGMLGLRHEWLGARTWDPMNSRVLVGGKVIGYVGLNGRVWTKDFEQEITDETFTP